MKLELDKQELNHLNALSRDLEERLPEEQMKAVLGGVYHCGEVCRSSCSQECKSYCLYACKGANQPPGKEYLHDIWDY